jgi:lysophospholipase L1-like esterase
MPAALSVVVVISATACSTVGSGSASLSPAGTTGSPAAATATDVEGTSAEAGEPLRLVTLGDAYTAGTDTIAPKRDSWPAQLVQAMERGDVPLRLVDNLAESGQTSEDVIRTQLGQLESLLPDVVTIQVGVNDIIARDISLEDYRANMTSILDELLRTMPPGRIFLITTPDHTLTERGGDYGSREEGHAAVVEANAILRAVAAEGGVTVIDIGPVNQRVADDASLVIGGGPYPTAKQYAGWVEVIGPQMRRVLTGEEP